MNKKGTKTKQQKPKGEKHSVRRKFILPASHLTKEKRIVFVPEVIYGDDKPVNAIIREVDI